MTSCGNWQNLPHAPPVLCSICTYNNVMVWPSSPPPVHHLTSTDRPNNSPTQGESWVNRSCISSTKTPLELWCVLYLTIMGVEVCEAIIARHITHYTIHMCIDLKKIFRIITDKIKYVQRKCHKIFFPQLLSRAMNVGVAKNSLCFFATWYIGKIWWVGGLDYCSVWGASPSSMLYTSEQC